MRSRINLQATRRAAKPVVTPLGHAVLDTLQYFINRSQLMVMLDHQKGEEGQFFKDKLKEMEERIKNMPLLYGQKGNDDPTVYLHYFRGGSDWYFTEKGDVRPGNEDCFGWVILNGDTQNAELGYSSIAELIGFGVELDLHFDPKPLSEVKRKYGK